MKLLIALVVLVSMLPLRSEPVYRCTDALCVDFQQEVAGNHQHSHRCADAACVNFQQFVPANHRHLHRNQNAQSPNFLEFVPERQRRRR